MADEPRASNVLERVDSFIRRFQDLDITSKPFHESDRELMHNLSDYLTDYLALPTASPFKEGLASLCEVWINRALAAGIMKEGEGLLRQLRRANQDYDKLLQENQKLNAELSALREELQALRHEAAASLAPQATVDSMK